MDRAVAVNRETIHQYLATSSFLLLVAMASNLVAMASGLVTGENLL